MSWLDSNYRFRIPVALDNTASGNSTSDASVTIPTDLADFWDNILSSGFDVRFTTADGITPIVFKRTSWTYASKVGVFELDAVAVTANRMCLVWLYWGYASATDGATSPSISAPITGYVSVEAPSSGLAVVVQSERPGATRPRTVLAKGSAEAVDVWWDFRQVLRPRASLYQRARVYEEISRVSLCDVQLATVSQAAMIDVTKTRFQDGFVSTRLQAGTSGTTYTAICQVVTAAGRTFEARALVKVKDVSEV